ncbi:MAG: hypothetical protein WBZ36_13610 [Candidatus Nitrosopolaris sp.]
MKEKGVTHIEYREPYSLVTINGMEITFKIFSSWNDTEESIYQAFRRSGSDQDIVYHLTTLLAAEFEKRQRQHKKQLELNAKPKSKYDADLVEIISNIVNSNTNDWQKSGNIWSRFVEYISIDVASASGSDVPDDGRKVCCRFGPVYKNTLVAILRSDQISTGFIS